MCPDCRFVFRVPRDHDGKGIVCPSCRRMLRIPTAADIPPPLMAPVRRVAETGAEEAPVAEPAMVRKRRKSRKGSGGDAHSWEHQPHSSRSRRGEKRQMTLMLAGGTALLALILGAVFFSMSGGGKKETTASPVAPAPVADAPTKPGEAAPPPTPARSNAELLAEAEPLARKFLEAKTVEEMLPLVRNPEVAGKRMRSFYQKDGVAAPGLSKFNSDGGFSVKGKLVSVNLVTGEFDQKGMAFVETPQGLRIDWESWAGWSEISWEDFRSKKPTEGHVFRVVLGPVEYYNFGFADESKWKSYRLLSPDNEHSVYGYVEKGSLSEERLRLDAGTKKVLLTLSLKFPAGAENDNQVEIDRFVNEGWVEEGDP